MRRLLTAALFAALLLVLGCVNRDEPLIEAQRLAAFEAAVAYAQAHSDLDPIVVEYKGASMMRSMGRGGFLIYQPSFPYNALEKGDIVIYWYESKTTNVAHELVMLRGQSWITAGDSNRMADIDLLTRDNYRGKVLKYFQYRGVR